MAMVDTLWLATLTKDQRDAGTDTQRLNLIVNIDGEDVVDTHFYFRTSNAVELNFQEARTAFRRSR